VKDNKLWQEVLSVLQNTLKENEINIWLKPLKIEDLRGDLITLSAPNKFIKNWVEEKYINILIKTFNEYLSTDLKNVKINLNTKEKNNNQTSTYIYETAPEKNKHIFNTNLNKDYTFDSFVEGNSNQFASAAARAVADGNFNVYNPLFIYGGVGLGKTHLMHATGNKILEKFPKLKVMYVSSENWTNEFIQAMRTKKWKILNKNIVP
jgi:chromosomal replication initiator protein